MNNYRLRIRLGNEIVASNVHYRTWELADSARKKLLSSSAVRGEKEGSIGVLVMHWKKFKTLVSQDKATTIARLQANALRFPELAEQCNTVTKLKQLQRNLAQEFNHHA